MKLLIAVLALAFLCLFILKALMVLSQRITNSMGSRQYRITRIYNEKGIEVQNRFTEAIEDGYWVTVVTDPINHKVVFAEHTRTDANTIKNKGKCTEQEHAYNSGTVWGEVYGGPMT